MSRIKQLLLFGAVIITGTNLAFAQAGNGGSARSGASGGTGGMGSSGGMGGFPGLGSIPGMGGSNASPGMAASPSGTGGRAVEVSATTRSWRGGPTNRGIDPGAVDTSAATGVPGGLGGMGARRSARRVQGGFSPRGIRPVSRY